LPIIPCLVARPDLTATLFEASQKKSVFLREALRRAGTGDAAKVVNERFEKTPTPAAPFITCRAIERFAEMFPQLYEWSPRRSRLLLFAGEAIRVEIEKAALPYRAILIPASERRYLFIVDRDTTGDNAGRNSHPAAS
jgi:16S rRNA G527 N7-methylase RsmG